MAKTKCPKCKGAGCSHCGGKGYHTKTSKRSGYKHGGLACGASMKPTQSGTPRGK